MPVSRDEPRLGRRAVLVTATRAPLGIAVLGLAACRPGGSSAGSPRTPGSTPSGGSLGRSEGEVRPAVAWGRVDLGFVSAYVLVRAGDALNGTDDGSAVLGPDPEFTPDMDTATASVAALAGLDVDTILFGHGEPFVGDAAAGIAALVE